MLFWLAGDEGLAMRIGRIFYLLRYWIIRLLIRSVRLLALIFMFGAILFLLVVFAGEEILWKQNGVWHPLPVSSLLQRLEIELPATELKNLQQISDVLLNPAALLLAFVAAISAYRVKRSMDNAENRLRRHKSQVADRKKIIEDIERALGASPQK